MTVPAKRGTGFLRYQSLDAKSKTEEAKVLAGTRGSTSTPRHSILMAADLRCRPELPRYWRTL
jgi:hypothetical protein